MIGGRWPVADKVTKVGTHMHKKNAWNSADFMGMSIGDLSSSLLNASSSTGHPTRSLRSRLFAEPRFNEW
jgi:hypothetical protein